MIGVDDVFDRLAKAFESAESSASRCGVVRRYDDSKGYGFIRPDDGGPDVFFHKRVVRGEVGTGQCVDFESEMGDKGPRATMVCVSFIPPSSD
jgi:CspA family cold shock protein